MKRTKIVCTIGPASERVPTLKRLLRAGMNVARLNFSHGTYENHALLIRNIRRASKETGIPVAILQDLQGPRIRIGDLPKEGVPIKRGELITLVPQTSKTPSVEKKHSVSKVLPQQYRGLARDVKKGTPILIADGAMTLRVESVHDDTIRARVVVGGVVKAHKGINVPGVTLGAKPITAKDRRDLAFGIQQGVDFVTLSFVKDARDMQALRRIVQHPVLDKKYSVLPQIVAKVERPEAVLNIEAIALVSDAVMLGRGDLALEANPAKLGVMQEDVLAACLKAGKPVITATQMLESMTEHPRPTRAELLDIAEAVMSHTDATMLSGETAGGKFPVEACATMADVIRETEASKYDDLNTARFGPPRTPEEKGAAVIAATARDLGVAAIVVAHRARSLLPFITRLRPETRIIPLIKNDREAGGLFLAWGTYPLPASSSASPARVVATLRRKHILRRGDRVLVVKNIKHPMSNKKQAFELLTA